MGLSSSVAVLNAMGFFACGMLAVLNFKYINWRELAKMTCGMLPFLALGIWLDTVLPLPVLLRIYGAIIVFIGIRNLLSKEQRFLSKWLLAIIVAAAGLIQGMLRVGRGVPRYLRRAEDEGQAAVPRHAFRVVGHPELPVCPARLHARAFHGDVVLTVGICIPIAIVANILGQVIQKRISQEKFLKLTYVLLLLVGLVLLITS